MLTDDHDIPASEIVVATGEQLDQHAVTVSGLAQRAELARGAARQVGLDADAYGLICSFIPRHLTSMQERIAAAIGLEADTLTATGAALRSVGANYRTVDSLISQRVEAIYPPQHRGDTGEP